MPPRLDPFSLAAIAIDQFFRETHLGVATSFVWRRREQLYLITNWHAVTCRNNETGKHLTPEAAEPSHIIGHFRAQRGSFETQQRKIVLRDKDDIPLWLHHPAHGRRVDVIAIPLPKEYETFVTPINELDAEPLLVKIGMDVFILGFPFGAKAPALPIWKRGSIASEPEIVRQGDMFYLVDTASRPGMSGAPVILRTYGVHLTESGPSIKTDPATKIIGIYSGRLRTAETEAQLARVWPASFITEIIDANERDKGAW